MTEAREVNAGLKAQSDRYEQEAVLRSKQIRGLEQNADQEVVAIQRRALEDHQKAMSEVTEALSEARSANFSKAHSEGLARTAHAAIT